MLEEYVYKGKEKLRCGYTTGTCATAAAKAAAIMLIGGCKVNDVFVQTPKGIGINLTPVDVEINESFVSCGIVKDSGDDPDITNGITVYAKVSLIKSGIEINGGIGVGTVTKKGLDQPVGHAAINSTPRKMIKEHLLEVIEEQEYKGGLAVEISIPEGVELARKTFNPKLGIEGGISVIGTTGIVEPMSNVALIDTIKLEENMRHEEGKQYILCTLGNYGKSFLANEMPNVLDKCVTCSNFIGEALDIAVQYNFKGVLIVGHIGKMVKLASGIMNTHSSNADGRMEALITCGVMSGIETDILKKMMDCVTVDDAISLVINHSLYSEMVKYLMNRIEYHLNNRVHGEIKTAAVIFSNKYGVIGKTSLADELRDIIIKEDN